MTREEYEKLLKSDYWKGYSYSLIKERNFTCEDCGRQFPNERNKLQVHHLVYRDVNPWSYRPNEVVVLCEECHKKRHGIKDKPCQDIQDSKIDDANTSPTNIPFSTSNYDDWITRNIRWSNTKYRHNHGKKHQFKIRYLLYLLLFIVFLSYLWNYSKQETTTEIIESPETTEIQEKALSTSSNNNAKRIYHKTSNEDSSNVSSYQLLKNMDLENVDNSGIQNPEDSYYEYPSAIESTENNKNEEVTEPQRVSVGIEETTSRINERKKKNSLKRNVIDL